LVLLPAVSLLFSPDFLVSSHPPDTPLRWPILNRPLANQSVNPTAIKAPAEEYQTDLLAIVMNTAIAASVASVNAHVTTTGTTAPSLLRSS
jgi:hypothetical protein